MTDLILLLILACALVSLLTPVFADDSKAADQATGIDNLLTEIKRVSKSIADLEKRLTVAEGFVKTALDSRMIRLHELGDSSVNFIVRPWVNKDDYWETYWTLNRAMKLRFDEEGISIPFPQRDVHLHKVEPGS